MSDRKPWFSRAFAFDVEPWAYPNLLERVRGTPARIEERLRGVPAGGLTERFDGQWSIQENAGHLLDLEPLWAGRLDDFEYAADRLRAADLDNRRTHDAGHNAVRIEDVLSGFRRERAVLAVRSTNGVRVDDEAERLLHELSYTLAVQHRRSVRPFRQRTLHRLRESRVRRRDDAEGVELDPTERIDDEFGQHVSRHAAEQQRLRIKRLRTR